MTQSDVAITNHDQDKFERGEIVSRISRRLILEEGNPSIVVSIESPWGAGKTSVLNLVREQLEKSLQKPIVVNFNPWLIGARDSLVQSFLIELAAAIQVPDRPEEGRQAAEQLLKYSSVFSVLKLVPGAEPWASLVQKVLKGVGNAVNDISELKKLDVSARRKDVENALAKLRRPIIVIVDDIDRLVPVEVYEILRFLKAVCDFPRVAYLVAFDQRYVIECLEKCHAASPATYIGKIVQERVPLPPPLDHQLTSYLESRLEGIDFDHHDRRFPKWRERFTALYNPTLRRLLSSPRIINQVVNRVRFSFDACQGDVSFGDLIGLETLAVTALPIYETIRELPEAFVGVASADYYSTPEKPNDVVKSHSEMRTSLLEELPARERRYTVDLVESLFPLTVADSSFNLSAIERSRQQGLIAEASRLRIALNLAVPSFEVSGKTVREFIETPSVRSSTTDALVSDAPRIERFLVLLRDELDESTLSAIPQPANLLSEFARMLASPQIDAIISANGAGLIEVGLDQHIQGCAESLLKKFDVSARTELIQNLLESDFTLSTLLVRGIHEESAPSTEPKLKVSDAATLTKKWLSVAKQKLLADGIGKHALQRRAFFFWLKVEPDGLKVQLRDWLKDDDNFLRFALLMAPSIRSSRHGLVAAFDDELVEAMGNPEQVRHRAGHLIESRRLNGRDAASLEALATGKRIVIETGEPEDW